MEALELGGVGQLGAGLYQETDPEGLQPSASLSGPLKPTMTLEKGQCWAMQEWKHTSSFDRMNFYEMVAK